MRIPTSRARLRSLLVAVALVGAQLAADAQDRMPPIPTAELTEEQAQALAEFAAARGQPTGPWIALLRSAELMTRTRRHRDGEPRRFYTMISMILNTSRAPLPDGAKPALEAFPY